MALPWPYESLWRCKMIAVVCLDDLNGMMFNSRRQSRDRLLIGDLLSLVGTGILWMAPYSLSLFPDDPGCRIEACDDFLEKAGAGEFAFVEDRDLTPYNDRTEEIVVYRWNKLYPRDMTFPLDLSMWTSDSAKEFPGYSHEIITREIYKR